jgi:hypothetical protein
MISYENYLYLVPYHTTRGYAASSCSPAFAPGQVLTNKGCFNNIITHDFVLQFMAIMIINANE